MELPGKEGKGDKGEDAEKASGAGSEGKTDLSANPDGQEVAADPKNEKKKSGGFCACFSKKKKEDEEKPPDGEVIAGEEPVAEEVPPPPAEKKPSNKRSCCACFGGICQSTFCYYLFWYYDGIKLFGYRNHHAPTPHAGHPKWCDSRKALWLIWVLFVICMSFSIY